MGNKRSYQNKLRVQMKYLPAPDIQERLSRAVNILLKAARRNISESEDSRNSTKREPPREVPTEETVTGGVEEGDPNE